MSSYTLNTTILLISFEVQANSLFFLIGGIPWYVYLIVLQCLVTMVEIIRLGPHRVNYKQLEYLQLQSGKDTEEHLMDDDEEY